MKKKIINLVTIFIICILTRLSQSIFLNANASNSETYTFNIKIKNNTNNDNVDIYILLPKEYIIYVINHDNLDIEYEGVETLKNNNIPNISVKKENIQDKLYKEENKEYISILLEENEDGIYQFEALQDYTNMDINMDIKFRIKNDNRDYIMDVSNFNIENNICEIQYDYDKNEIKQPGKIKINFGTVFLIILAILLIITAIISKKKTENKQTKE
mgnify:FL=1